MQTKSSYRVLKWALMATVVSSFVTACVIKEGDPDDFDFGDGGDGNTNTSGTKATGGEGTSGSKTTGGGGTGGSGGQSTAGTSSQGGDDASGGEPSNYVAGQCDAQDPTPSSVPSCNPSSNDKDQTCKICLKASCCDTWQTCYGDTPTSACGWGVTENAPGQFDCIQQCYEKGAAEATDFDDLLDGCQSVCLNQCEDSDQGFVTDITNSLIICAQEECETECFPVQ
jgi:hypothetical protein